MISPAKYVIQPAQNVNLAETNMDSNNWGHNEHMNITNTNWTSESHPIYLRKLGGDSTTVANFAENHIVGHLITNIIG